MRILLCGQSESPHLYRWYKFLKRLNYEVDVLSLGMRQQSNTYTYDKQSYIGIKNGRNDVIGYIKIFSTFIKKIIEINSSDYEIVNFHYFNIVWVFFGIFLKKSYVYTLWGSDINVFYDSCKRIKKVLCDIALKKASGITCDSMDIQDKLQKKCKYDIHKKIKIIHWGVDLEEFYEETAEIKHKNRDRYGIPRNNIVLMNMRGMNQRYGNLEIIKWFRKNVEHDRYTLFIHYTTEDDTYVLECKKEAKSDKRIIFHNKRLEDGEIRGLINISNVIFNFPCEDATPVSMLESLACKVAVICSEKIKSYSTLSEKYHMLLTSLDNLREKDVEKFINENRKYLEEDQQTLRKNDSKEATQRKIQNIFSDIVERQKSIKKRIL